MDTVRRVTYFWHRFSFPSFKDSPLNQKYTIINAIEYLYTAQPNAFITNVKLLKNLINIKIK